MEPSLKNMVSHLSNVLKLISPLSLLRINRKKCIIQSGYYGHYDTVLLRRTSLINNNRCPFFRRSIDFKANVPSSKYVCWISFLNLNHDLCHLNILLSLGFQLGRRISLHYDTLCGINLAYLKISVGIYLMTYLKQEVAISICNKVFK